MFENSFTVRRRARSEKPWDSGTLGTVR